MEFISPIITILAMVFMVRYSIRQSKASLPVSAEHSLVRTWVGEDPAGLSVDGWRWECSCGTQGVAGNANNEGSLGSEDNTIGRYKNHAKNFQDANRNEWKELYLKKEADFAEYRNKCYCKDTNDDLILLRHG